MGSKTQKAFFSREYSFTGKQRDSATGLAYFNARYYDAGVGRFTTLDPVKDGVNWYVYCYNNPLKYIDLTGEAPVYAYTWLDNGHPNKTEPWSHSPHAHDVYENIEPDGTVHYNELKGTKGHRINLTQDEINQLQNMNPGDRIKIINTKDPQSSKEIDPAAGQPNIEIIEQEEQKKDNEYLPDNPLYFPNLPNIPDIPPPKPEMIIPPIIIIIVILLLSPVGV